MLRWMLLVLAVACLALASLTVVPAPTWTAWELAVLAGEYGHIVAVVPLAVALLAGMFMRSHPRFAVTAAAAGLVACALLLKPCFQAWAIASRLPQQLASQFGPAEISRAPFSVAQLLERDPEPVPVRTFNLPDGLPLDFYAPPGASDRRRVPCVVLVHGGGWNAGDRKQIPAFNHWLAHRGYAVAAISYRLAPAFQWPAQRDDVLNAIAWLQSRAHELGVDAERLVLAGRSAGGQIAQTVAYTARNPAIRGVIAFYAPSDLHFGYVNTHENDMIRSPQLMRQYLGGPPETARARYDDASALYHVSRDAPPTLLLHGENDTLVWHRHSVRLEAKLREHKVPCVFVSLPWATHAFDYHLQGPGGQLTLFATEWFLARVTR